jgi:hypothetical protein
MDPEVAWNEMLDAIAETNLADAKLRAESLLNWIERGGFVPQTVKRSIPDEWNRLICDRVCWEVLRTGNRSRK